MEGVGTFNLINNTDDIYSKIIPLQYPKVGTTNSAIKAGVVNINTTKTVWFKFSGDSRNYYLPRMQWAGNSKHVAIQHLNRKQNTLSLYLAEPGSGQLTLLFKEKSKAWLDAVDDMIWFDQGRSFTWISDRDGWSRAYTFSRNGKLQHKLTPPKQDVIKVYSINPEADWMYYSASPDNATQRYLYRTSLHGKTQTERITPVNADGTHAYNISPNQKWAIHNYSRLMTPNQYTLIELPTHKITRSLVDNQVLRTKLSKLIETKQHYFKVKLNKKITADAWMMTPPDFDANKKYPVVFYVYAEPWGQTVIDAWRGSRILWHKLLAEHGYIVVSTDNRGTPAPRGRSWRKSVYKKLGSLTSADQAAAAREIIKLNYIDKERVAIWGRSGGGTHTLNALFRYPDLYKTGISVAPVPDIRLYDTIYQERYSGVLPDDLDDYIENSAITYAHQLKGNLLLLHGTGDDNVHYQGTEKLINKLIEHNLPFMMVPYPNRRHGISSGTNTSLHKRSTMLRYLKQHVSNRSYCTIISNGARHSRAPALSININQTSHLSESL